MAKLKLGPIAIDKPVKVTLSLPGALHRDLTEYADVLARETGQPIPDPVKLVVSMLERFISTNREFGEGAKPLGHSAPNQMELGRRLFPQPRGEGREELVSKLA